MAIFNCVTVFVEINNGRNFRPDAGSFCALDSRSAQQQQQQQQPSALSGY
jgi:hypothetical protein